jgi:hypothetical protein
MTDFQPQGSNLTCDADIRLILEKRFGKNKAGQLLDVYQHSYINEQDFDNVKKLNFNCIRLPFFYKILEDDDKPGVYKKHGWDLLDFAVSNCATRNIYCIIDLHGTPGGQSADHTTGQTGLDNFFKKKKYQDRTVKLWEAIARRYKNESAVAGYDLINEPYGAPSKNALIKIYDRLYKVIRTIDKKHIIFLADRGPWHGGLNELPSPKKAGWKNVVYQTHLYDFKNWGFTAHKKLIDNFAREEIARKKNVPILIGEFHPWGNKEVWKMYFTEFNSNNWNWTLWTYKCSSKAGDWGIYRTAVIPNILKDSFSELSNKFSHYSTELTTSNRKQIDVLKNGANPTAIESALASSISKLSSTNKIEADASYETLYQIGYDAIPFLINNSTNTAQYAGKEYINDYSSFLYPAPCVGVISLYVVEAIIAKTNPPLANAFIIRRDVSRTPISNKDLSKLHNIYTNWWIKNKANILNKDKFKMPLDRTKYYWR